MKLQYSQKTENRPKACSESIYHKKYVKVLITNKTGKLKVNIKASICKKHPPTFAEADTAFQRGQSKI